MIRLTVALTPEGAAALKRFAEKISYEQAASVLYGHIKADIRAEQASQIITAFDVVNSALADAGVSSWPWIDTGRA